MKIVRAPRSAQARVVQTVRDTYDQIAPQYAAQNVGMPPNLVEAAALFARLLPPGALVLDLGCGAGRDMSWLRGLGLKVVGLDHSAGMLGEARLRVGSGLLLMNMRFPGLRSRRFQGVWCCASLLHLTKLDVPAAVRQMARVLAAGGTLFLSVQEGVGEGWEDCPYARGERFYARYRRKK